MNDVALALHAGLVSSDVTYCVYLPDSVMNPLTSLLENDRAIATYVCAREDEGVAICAGLFVAGKRSVVIMECSGIGYCGLILARCQLQRTPVFIIASHGGFLGEPFEYHAAPVAAGRGVVEGLDVAHLVLRPDDDYAEIVRLALQTVHGQRRSFVLFVPPYVMSAGAAKARA